MNNLLDRISATRNEFIELYDMGVLDLNTSDSVQVTKKLFKQIIGDNTPLITSRGTKDYPYRLSFIVEGVQYITICTTSELIDLGYEGVEIHES